MEAITHAIDVSGLALVIGLFGVTMAVLAASGAVHQVGRELGRIGDELRAWRQERESGSRRQGPSDFR